MDTAIDELETRLRQEAEEDGVTLARYVALVYEIADAYGVPSEELTHRFRDRHGDSFRVELSTPAPFPRG